MNAPSCSSFSLLFRKRTRLSTPSWQRMACLSSSAILHASKTEEKQQQQQQNNSSSTAWEESRQDLSLSLPLHLSLRRSISANRKFKNTRLNKDKRARSRISRSNRLCCPPMRSSHGPQRAKAVSRHACPKGGVRLGLQCRRTF